MKNDVHTASSKRSHNNTLKKCPQYSVPRNTLTRVIEINQAFRNVAQLNAVSILLRLMDRIIRKFLASRHIIIIF